VEDRAQMVYLSIKSRSKKKNLKFDLTLDWLLNKLKKGICEITGLPFSEKIQRPAHRYAPSVDRIDPKKGYVKDNCRVVLLMVNHIKRDYTDEEVAQVGLAMDGYLQGEKVPSDLEEMLCCQIQEAGLDGGMVRELRAIPKRRFRIDFAWPDLKLAVEVQGGLWTRGRHSRPMGIVKDYEKFNLLTLHGWRVLLLTSLDVRGEKGLEMIRDAISQSSSSSESPPEE